MTPTEVAKELEDKISRDGPISVADYMSAVAEAYYSRGDVFGRAGDFVTAPEISQVFGELIGLWCVTAWQSLGAPRAFHMVECGPGRGTLMADALRTIAETAPDFMKEASIHLVEQSAALQGIQAAKLEDWDIQWHEDLSTLPKAPTIVIGNEFLDALPTEQYEKTPVGWCKRLVDHRNGEFQFVTAPDATHDVGDAYDDAETGSILERSSHVEETIKGLAGHCVEHHGAVLMIDYGHTHSDIGDTLQAVKGHTYHPVLKDPGSADLTAHVDFALVTEAARSEGAHVFGPVEQGLWLRRLGVIIRESQLMAGKPSEQQDAIRASIRRLIDPDGMGLLFKVIAFATPDVGALAGFEV